MGRPPKDPSDRRTRLVGVPVTDAEGAILDAAAEASGVKLAVWARDALLRAGLSKICGPDAEAGGSDGMDQSQSQLADAARRFGVSRKTAFKWLARHDAQPDVPLRDRSRRPQRSPRRTSDDLERLVLDARDRWGS